MDDRDDILRLPDADLLRRCRVDVYRGTGHGGQKRNRTDSAVRVTYLETGTAATCDETRSQHTNRTLALRRLRRQIALTCRRSPASAYAGPWRPALRTTDHPVWMAHLLDILAEESFRVSEAARRLGVSTGRLVRDIASDPALWQTVNAGRVTAGLAPLKAP
ncbi:MAG: peptide chain release factor-like protein [Lentisphaeria bacterium]|nr:peptide chain release factor-like protein [Lentisphaeria bacterium]